MIDINIFSIGGLVLGADIDYLTLHARSRPSRVGQKVAALFFVVLILCRIDQVANKPFLQVRAVDESMAANFQQYGLASRSFDIGFEELIMANISGTLGLLQETQGKYVFDC